MNTTINAHPSHPRMSVFRPADAPLHPVDGDPYSSASEVWTSPDGSKKVGSYRIREGGEAFQFVQKFHESSYILSGHMIVTMEDGTRFDLRAGDLAQLIPGTSVMIKIAETVHDFFIITSTEGPVEV